MDQVILEQQKTGERIGQIMCRLNLISQQELLKLLSKQYKLKLFPYNKLIETQKNSVVPIPEQLAHWLMQHDVTAVSVDEAKGILTIGIEDPTNELLIEKVINHIFPYKARFVLIDFTGSTLNKSVFPKSKESRRSVSYNSINPSFSVKSESSELNVTELD